MKSYSKIMKNIERLGERYNREYLNCWDKKVLQNNWWEALKFFFSHSFMSGRRDELSNEYYHFTIKTLEDYFTITNENLEESYERLKKQKDYFDKECILNFKMGKKMDKRANSLNKKHEDDFNKEIAEKNPIVKLLITQKEVKVKWDNETYEKEVLLGNDADVMMVLDVLKFISDDEKKNIYNYLRNMIANREVKSAYRELTKMRAISDKIATFIIRDIGLLNPEIKIADKDYKLAFPVDTWVIQIARKLDCNNKNIKEIKNYLIENCKKSHIDPLKFAAGLWFLGFHSLDILLENCLGEIEIGNITSANSG